jgi:sigma-E factor negative regulatory protein RseC
MEETGKVVEVLDHLAKVELSTTDACATCGAKFMCHPTPGGTSVAVASNEVGARVGDLVRVRVDPRQSILTGFMLFIFPIVAFLAGFLVVRVATDREGYAVLTGVASLGLYFVLLKKLESLLSRRGVFRPRIREIVVPVDS